MPLDHEKLKALRIQRGMTQAEAAEAAGMERQNYSAIEGGRRENITIGMLDRIAIAMKISPAKLLAVGAGQRRQ